MKKTTPVARKDAACIRKQPQWAVKKALALQRYHRKSSIPQLFAVFTAFTIPLSLPTEIFTIHRKLEISRIKEESSFAISCHSPIQRNAQKIVVWRHCTLQQQTIVTIVMFHASAVYMTKTFALKQNMKGGA